MKKYIKWFGIGFGAIFLAAMIYIGIAWGNKIVILSSLKQVNGNDKNYPFYTMTYKGDYGFEDYLKIGSKNRKEYFKYIIKNTMNGVNGASLTSKPNCSSFTVTAPNGDRLFARNLDTQVAMPLLLKTNSNNSYKSISMVNLAWLDLCYGDKYPLPFSMNSINTLGAPYIPTDGMNEYGLGISFLTAEESVSFDEDNKVSINEFSLMRMILNKATNVEEAVKMIESYNVNFYFSTRGYPSHLMIADAKGCSVVVEFVKGKMQTVYSDKPYQVATNFILYDNPNGGFGLDRYKRIDEKLKETDGTLTEKDAMKLLSENIIKGQEQWSVVYNLTQKKSYVCVGKDYNNIYEFSID